ncbi:MAG: hypothetical protein U1F42_10685 [Candidatus Competibacteraceae bacterium]
MPGAVISISFAVLGDARGITGWKARAVLAMLDLIQAISLLSSSLQRQGSPLPKHEEVSFMKVNVSIEATAQEMREFLGLPNVQPLHDDFVQALRDNMQRGMTNFDSLRLLKPLLPAQFTSMEMIQKFWEAVAKASSTTKDSADKKSDNVPESLDTDAARNDPEKAS